MKFSLAGVLAISLGASTAFAAFDPAPTPHHHLVKRQDWPHGINITHLLEDPKVYLKHVKSMMADEKQAKKYAQHWASATNDASFQHSLSAALAKEFGTKTAQTAMAQYSHAVIDFASSSSAAAAAAASASASAAVVPAVNNAANADSNASTSSASVHQVTNAVTGAGSSLTAPFTFASVLVAAIPAVLVVVL